MRILILVFVSLGCAAQQKFYTSLPEPDGTAVAISVARKIMDSTSPGWLSIEKNTIIEFIAPNCTDKASGREGMFILTGQCVGGVTGRSTRAAIVLLPGMKLSESGFSHEIVHMWEFWKFGMGDVNHSTDRWKRPDGLAWKKMIEIEAALQRLNL